MFRSSILAACLAAAVSSGCSSAVVSTQPPDAVSGTGASATSLDGSNPVHFQTLALGLVWIEIRGRTLTAEFIGADGQVEYSRTVTK